MPTDVLKLNKKKSLLINVLLIVIVVLLAIIPLFVAKGADFEGADGKAEEAISEIAAEYEPWFSPLLEPSSGEIESMLFALQAAIGAGIIGYGLGYLKGKRKQEEVK